MVTISLSSNIVNFFYIALFDITMPIALAWSTAILFSSVNLKIIHDERKVLWLREVPVPHLFNPGVSTRLIGLAVAIASGLVVILPIVGSFSINGVSTPTSKEVSYIVDGATSEDVLDLSQHRHTNETDIPQGAWTEDQIKNSLKCRTPQNDLETKAAVKLISTKQSPSRLENCNVTVPSQAQGSVVQVNPTLKGDCPFRILGFFCAKAERYFCTGWVESKSEIFLFVAEFPKTPASNTLLNSGRNHIENFTFPERPPTEALRSIGYLIGSNSTTSIVDATLMSLLTLKRNGIVMTLETVDETIVNETLFVAAITPGLVITLGFALGSCTSRYLYRTKQKRGHYNSFLSARDMLSCALNECKAEGNSREDSSESCFVTNLDGDPFLVVQQEDEKYAQS